jgi:carboxypeptidase Taq
MSTDPEVGKLIDTIMRHPKYEDIELIQQRNVHLIKKNYDEQTKLPESLVAALAKQQAISVDVWKKAKAAKNFSMFKPELEKIVELEKQVAEIFMKVKETTTAYDALVDIYEPKMTSKTISEVFNELREGLITIIKKCEDSPKQPDTSILHIKIPIETQRKISQVLADFVGYDTESRTAGGRIDETEHPFTTGYYDDVRITTHYHEDNFASSMYAVLHEAGHALYEQNLRQDWKFQPVGSGCSMGFHESQSRFVENVVGRSHEFLGYFLPKLKKITGSALSDVKLDQFVHAVNQVKPSKIRVEADEVTYGLHIIVRFNLERELFSEKATVKELPELWNQSYKDYLGIRIQNDSEGVMQDTHWASGYFGYFPSYALGNIYSGQILETMQKDLPTWRRQISEGKFAGVKDWLVKNVHSYGNLYDASDLIQKITGCKLTVKPYLSYLKEKCSKLYGF